MIRGRVTLVGSIVSADGTFQAHREVVDADGVAVELLYGTEVIDRTTTIDGIYTFGDLPPGAYAARASLPGFLSERTPVLTIANTDVFAGQTLRLASFGNLVPAPNPFGAEIVVYFDLPDTEYVELRVWSLAGDSVRTLLRGRRPPGTNQVRWDGTDRNDIPVPGPMYWITMTGPPPDVRAHLLFR